MLHLVLSATRKIKGCIVIMRAMALDWATGLGRARGSFRSPVACPNERPQMGTTGRVRIEGGTAFGHGDLVVSAALALYLSDHRTIGAHIGVSPLAGYW